MIIRTFPSDTPGASDGNHRMIIEHVHRSVPSRLGRAARRHGARMTDLSMLGAATAGVWSRAQALALLTADQVDGFVRRGVWQRPWRGVYADAGQVLDAEQRAVAAVLAAGGAYQPLVDPATGRRSLRAVACGRTAARVWGLPLIDDMDPATGAWEHVRDDVAVWRHLRQQAHGGLLLQPYQLTLTRADVVRRPSGLWVTTPLRTLVDCAQLLSPEALVCAMDQALHHATVLPSDLQSAASTRRGRAGSPAFAEAVRLSDGRAEAPTESLARLLLAPVLPALEPQVELFDRAARLVARFDLGDRTVRLAVEADGKRAHAGEAMVAKDRRRDRRALEHGWTTERTTWFELRRQQSSLVQRVVATHRRLTAQAAAAYR